MRRFAAWVTALLGRRFPAIHRRCDSRCRSHLPVTIMREPELVMSVQRILTVLGASALVCGAPPLAQAQSESPKAQKSAAKPATSPNPEAAKPETRPAAAVAGIAEPM